MSLWSVFLLLDERKLWVFILVVNWRVNMLSTYESSFHKSLCTVIYKQQWTVTGQAEEVSCWSGLEAAETRGKKKQIFFWKDQSVFNKPHIVWTLESKSVLEADSDAFIWRSRYISMLIRRCFTKHTQPQPEVYFYTSGCFLDLLTELQWLCVWVWANKSWMIYRRC